MRDCRLLRVLTPLLGVIGVSSPLWAADASAGVDYERDVRPLLATKCAACHGVLKQQAGLRLDAAVLILKGSENGPVVLPGKSGESPLIARISSGDNAARMPPEGEGEHLTEPQVALLKAWIDQGAKAPADEKIPEDPAQHWSYRPMSRPAVPAVKNANWVRNPIDAFIATEHEKRGLSPRGEAPREVWLRRVHLDLLGLPPTRDELRAFLKDESPDAHEKVVDALLQHPAYGERWGRHWMDVWRYSDWYGSRAINEIRYSQRHIWRWRDWIVDSVQADKPYDRMIIEMLAGDEFAPTDPDVLRATGFLGRNWYKFDRNVWMFETIEQTSQAFLAATFKCCRCHDHKFDPITQDDYYRFRAFFEPHNVRTDALAPNTPTEKDATLGQVLKDGVARVYDKELDAKTFVFQRGDNRYPDEKRPAPPGVPESLNRVMGSAAVEVRPVALPAEAWYPALRPEMARGLVAQAEVAVQQAIDNHAKAKQTAAAAQGKVDDHLARVARGEVPLLSEPPPTIRDDFKTQKSDVWKVASGEWKWTDGKLLAPTVSSFATVVSVANFPRDFHARVKYRTHRPGTYRSVGFSFDQNGPGDSQDVYTSVNDTSPAVQAFHRVGGQQHYPQAGIVPTPLKIGEEITVEATARGQQLTIAVNGVKKLDYVMPVARRDGKFALWVHEGVAEFLEVEVRPLVPTLESMKRDAHAAACGEALAAQKVHIAESEVASIRARLTAERAKYGNQPAETIASSAREASRAEKSIAVEKAREAALVAEQHRDTIAASLTPMSDAAAIAEIPGASPPALGDAEKKLADAQAALATAEKARDSSDEKYAPLGETFPPTSTGRRLALAKWIADPRNPRTARVAVNHVWLRHFGQAIVPSVANFGLNGDRPSHPEMLDWLAVEFVESGWRMKPLHRMLVLSATYRQSSIADWKGANPQASDASKGSAGTAVAEKSSNLQSEIRNPQLTDPQSVDPTNRFLWRMNSRRMEAEAVRDAVLFTAGTLDPTRGGPEIPESDGQTVLRRSLYFRNTPNEKMKFLEFFDVANPNECYRRKESVVPQQALALMNSGLALDSARTLAEHLSQSLGERDDADARRAFITAAFESILSRRPTEAESTACLRFLESKDSDAQTPRSPAFPASGQGPKRAPSANSVQRSRENLVHVLYSHNDFVTIR